MNSRYKISLLLIILAAFVVWLEPTRVAWGRLRGEEFYQGRPTSYWRHDIANWEILNEAEEGSEAIKPYVVRREGDPNKFERWFMRSVLQRRVLPGGHDIRLNLDELEPVLAVLVDDSIPQVRARAIAIRDALVEEKRLAALSSKDRGATP